MGTAWRAADPVVIKATDIELATRAIAEAGGPMSYGPNRVKRSCSAPFAIRSTARYRRASWGKRKDDERHRSHAVYGPAPPAKSPRPAIEAPPTEAAYGRS